MAILDWLKEIPLSAIYKERLVDSEKQIAVLEKENAALKQENTELKARLEELEKDGRTLKKKVINKSTESHSGRLGEIKEKLLLILSRKEAYGDGEIAKILSITEAVVIFHLNELDTEGFVKTHESLMEGMERGRTMEQKGLAYLIKNKLIS